MKETHTMTMLNDNMTCKTTMLFNSAEDIDTHYHLAGMNAATALPNIPVPLPRDLSALCSGTQDPWGTLSHHYH